MNLYGKQELHNFIIGCIDRLNILAVRQQETPAVNEIATESMNIFRKNLLALFEDKGLDDTNIATKIEEIIPEERTRTSQSYEALIQLCSDILATARHLQKDMPPLSPLESLLKEKSTLLLAKKRQQQNMETIEEKIKASKVATYFLNRPLTFSYVISDGELEYEQWTAKYEIAEKKLVEINEKIAQIESKIISFQSNGNNNNNQDITDEFPGIDKNSDVKENNDRISVASPG